VDRTDHAVVGLEPGPQVADVEERFRHYSTRRGSSASRKPSPMKLMVSTVRKIAAPAKISQCGAMSIVSLASNSTRPQVGISGGKPNPRNDRVDSWMMAAATSMVAATITGPRALGRM